VAGFWLLHQAEVELASRLEGEQRALASASAEATGTQLTLTLEGLSRSAVLVDWPSASRAEVEGALRLLAGQAPGVIAATVRLPRGADAPLLANLAGRPAVAFDRAGLLAALPLDELAAWGEPGLIALGPAHDSPEGPWLPTAIQVGARGKEAPVVVLALTLSQLDDWLVAHTPEFSTIEIVDGDGRVVASSAWHRNVRALDEGRRALVRANLSQGVTSTGEQVSTASVPGKLGLLAVVSLPVDRARAPLRALRRTVMGGMGLAATLLVIAALVFISRVTRRLDGLTRVATAYAKGDLSPRVAIAGEDELAELGRTFNVMGAELETSRARLLTWNDELKARVDAATAELRAAQAQLVEAQKLAALGQLGAGVAHEINNPLVGILGNAQLLLMEKADGDPDFALLRQIEESARRCREITQQLLRFSQRASGVSLSPVDLNAVVARTARLEAARLKDAGVELVEQLATGPVMVDADPEALEHVLFQLCANARTAMKTAATKQLTLRVVGGPAPAIEVIDTGRGIDPKYLERIFEPFFTTKDVWSNVGLGLSVSYRIVEQHQGRIEVKTALAQGSTFTVVLKPVGTATPTAPTVSGAVLS
jgi:signal transduction histidine kinase